MVRGDCDRVLTEDMKRVVRDQRLGSWRRCALTAPQTSPPKGTTAVWDDEHLVFADIRSPQTVKNLRANPAVEVNVVDPITRKGYRFKGEATVVDHGELFEQIMAFYDRVSVTGASPLHGRLRSAVLVTVESACRSCHRPTISASPRR